VIKQNFLSNFSNRSDFQPHNLIKQHFKVIPTNSIQSKVYSCYYFCSGIHKFLVFSLSVPNFVYTIQTQIVAKKCRLGNLSSALLFCSVTRSSFNRTIRAMFC